MWLSGRRSALDVAGAIDGRSDAVWRRWRRPSCVWAYDTASAWPENLREAPVPLEVLREIAGDARHAGDRDAPPPGYDENDAIAP